MDKSITLSCRFPFIGLHIRKKPDPDNQDASDTDDDEDNEDGQDDQDDDDDKDEIYIEDCDGMRTNQ